MKTKSEVLLEKYNTELSLAVDFDGTIAEVTSDYNIIGLKPGAN